MALSEKINKRCRAWKIYALPLLFALVIVLLRLWFGFIYHVPKEDETLGQYAGRYLLMMRLGSPERGQLVLATLHNKEEQHDTHRQPLFVAGLPGDTIESYAGAIYINGKAWYPSSSKERPSDTDWIAHTPQSSSPPPTSYPIDKSYYRLVLRSNEFWLLTYSIHSGIDSRHCGPIHRDRLYGIQAL